MRTVSLLVLLSATAVHAVEFGARAEAGVTLPLSSPQRELFGAGGTGRVTGVLRLVPAFDVLASFSYLGLSSTLASPAGQSAGGFLAGVGARGRLLVSELIALSLEAGPSWVLSAGASHVALEGGLGGAMRFSPQGSLWVGLGVRVTQVFPLGQRPGFDTASATVLSLVASAEFVTEPAAEPVTPPPPPPPADSDGDGVDDERDSCRGAAEDKDGFQDDDGCPDPDDDGDGVADGDDKCVRVKGPVASKGCPDGDGDGVADVDDDCPAKVGDAANRGCPKYGLVRVTETKIEINQKIFFAFGKDSILPKSFPLLDEVVQALVDHSRLCVRIEGHTDAVGSADQNLKLSEERTRAVKDYLVQHGVEGSRLEAKGYGSSLPLDSNATTEGREKNRRVEFSLIPCPGP